MKHPHILFTVLIAIVTLTAGCGGGAGTTEGGDAIPVEPITFDMQIEATSMGWGTRTVALPDDSTLLLGLHDATAIIGVGTPGETPVIAGGQAVNGFLSRIDETGSPTWTSKFTSTELAQPHRLDANPDGSSYVVGMYSGSMTLGAGTPGEVTLDSLGSQDAFLTRLDTQGQPVWARSIGTAAFEQGLAVALRPNGDVVCGGVFESTLVLGAGEPNETTLTAGPGGNDAFVACYGPDGALNWATSIVTDVAGSYVSIWDMDASADNGVIIAGSIGGVVTFGPGESSERSLISTDATRDFFVGRLAPDGSLEWVRQGGGNSQDSVQGVIVADNDSIHIFGSFAGGGATFEGSGLNSAMLQVSAGNAGSFVVSYDQTGEVGPALLVSDADDGAATSVRVLPDGSMVVGGWFKTQGVFAAGEALETTLNTAGGTDSHDGYIAGYAPDGSLAFVTHFSGDGYDTLGSVGVHQDGSIVATGLFQLDLVVGDVEDPAVSMVATGIIEGFLVRLGPDGAP